MDTVTITIPRWLRRLWIHLNTSPVDVIAPLDWSEEREAALLRGLSEIHRGTRDNLVFLDRYRMTTKGRS